MNIAEAKQTDLVEYLASLGYQPAKITRGDYWYHSPLREEKTPSFKVNKKSNVWYDHGTGKGGNFIDFGVLYHGCSVKELLSKLGRPLSFHQQPLASAKTEEPLIRVIGERSLVSFPLLRYIRQRRVSEEIAKSLCREVTFSIREKVHTAIGFPNNEGGFELRSPWFKGSVSPKAVTMVGTGSKELAVFEGFFDYMSYLTILQNSTAEKTDSLILNSTAFFEKCRGYMEGHEIIRLYLDRDTTGAKFTAQALAWSNRYKDESSLYKGYKDLNEWAQLIGKSLKKGLRQT